MRLYSHPGNDLTWRFPPTIESIARSRSRIIDGEAAVCDDNARSQLPRSAPVVGWVERLRETQVHMSARGDRTAWLGM
jgi:hypothetical protein